MFLISILVLNLIIPTFAIENCPRPSNCNQICEFGYLRDVNLNCTCHCAQDPCQAHLCHPGETCVVTGTRALCVPKVEQRPECPRLTGGVCALRCERDSDCQGRLICCSNGCGRECVVGMQSFPIKAQTVSAISHNADPINRILSAVRSLPENINSILPYPVPVRPEGAGAQLQEKNKIGQCPSILSETTCKEPSSECKTDFECQGYQKCCVSNCGNRCLDPIKTSACIHIALAVLRLPERHLINGYVPTCEENGKFSAIQCDSAECWCVDVNFGSEIPGTREAINMKRPNMCLNPRQCLRICDFSHCPHGLLLDESGCPVDGCLCKEICHGVKCTNSGDSCQLVEPDCASPPCLPVPRCLINACPMSQPMALATGVTALCAHDEQCSEGFWCHQVGYNGLGFCCIGTKPEEKDEKCPARQPIKTSSCLSTCKVDEECPNGKCCFDGCGLSCLSMKFKPLSVPIRPLHKLKSRYQPGEITRHNKELLSSLVADCPDLPPLKNCSMECRADGDCAGMKRCCRAGCGSRCVHFTKSTPCFHHALTADVYSMRTTFKCDMAGNFERKQCDDNHCFCVDVYSGEEIPGTRTEALDPKCDIFKKCEPLECQTTCLYGFERSPDGCTTCRCRNPCAEVKCPQGSACIMSSVECYQKENCPQQPRCVLNLCPIGEAAISPVGVVETCTTDGECPRDYWCHNSGIASGGTCCPLPKRPVSEGQCPKIAPQLESHGECRLECRADDDCPLERKCCFDGCGTTCLEVEKPKTPEVIEVKATMEKPGNCPHFDVRQCGFRERNNECSTDSQCIGVQKCCSDGCRRMCVYPDKNSACLLLKGAYQQIGLMNYVKCRPDGSFEQIQCNANFCWCVDRLGVEVEGTRTSEDISPTCSGRPCTVPLCVQEMDCKYGFKKDSNGCNTCECHSPCEGVTCPNSALCVPMPADCGDENCIEVPRCVVNPCPIGSPLLDPSSFDPLQCRESNQCVGTKSASYCQVFSPESGYCCPGPEPRSHPGTCPQAVLPTGDCSRHCVLDEQCSSGEKCCSNGCGISCQPAEFATSVHSNIRIGHCLKVPSAGAFCSQRQKIPECGNDSFCPPHMKCCFDGCTHRCSAPDITTQCIHDRLAALLLKEANPSVFVPECDSNGEYQQVQQHYGLRWCVDASGDEIPGTKTTKQPNCRYPRSCPVLSCRKNCPFGFKTNNDGCVVCDCRSPCELVECQAGSVCRVVSHRCLTENCHPVARCVPNACPIGEPLILEEHEMMAECNMESPCPAGYFCKKSGFMGKGFCCKGQAESMHRLTCSPVAAMNSSIDGSPCVTACRHATDCPLSTCCFNGCGTSCQFEIQESFVPITAVTPIPHPTMKSNAIKINTQIDGTPDFGGSQVIRPVAGTTVLPIGISLKTAFLKVGICPTTLLNPGCKEECLADADCPGFYKCCKASCAARCVPPTTTTSCIHKLLFYYKESPSIPPPVQCNDDGTYRQHQCDIRTKQCWCADRNNGKEIMGTRRSSELPLIDCSQPIHCAASCSDVEPMCPFGLRLDATGCPHNGICGCKNPCENIQCSSPLASCSLVKVSCLRLSCPPIPKCMPNLCGLNKLQTDEFGNPKSCSKDSDCLKGRCIVEESSDGHDIGLCCAYAIEPEEPLRQAIVTNCTLLRSAIERLYNNGASTSLLKPRCADISGHFTSVQCNPSGSCWCVDQYSGVEIPGSSTANAEGRNVCAAPRICPAVCSHAVCPFGFSLDRFGCPRADCRCSSPCDRVTCPKGKVCLLRSAICPSNDCNPLPVCEPSPCSNGDQPAMDSLTRRHFGCVPGRTICPNGYSCSVRNEEGFCCPSNEPFFSPESVRGKGKLERMSSCPHGDPFAGTSDGAPYTCTATGNGCPSTHYCVTEAGKRKGICCVSKRYVCNLRGERGPCSLSVPRYSYSSANKTCTIFEYGGCAGNLNNFATEEDCNDFCEGIGMDFTAPLSDDVDLPSEAIQLGFSVTGPMLEQWQQSSVQRSLLDVLSKQYKIPESALSDLYVKNGNNVRFTVTHPEAREFSKPLSEAVSTGKLAFDIDNVTYHVEPHTWYAYQIAHNSSEVTAGRMVFWGAIITSVVTALLIFFCVCIACCLYCQTASKDNESLRGSTPSNFVSHSIVAHRNRPTQRRESIFSREDLHEEEHYRRVERIPRATPSFRSVANNRPQQSFYF